MKGLRAQQGHGGKRHRTMMGAGRAAVILLRVPATITQTQTPHYPWHIVETQRRKAAPRVCDCMSIRMCTPVPWISVAASS